MSFKKFDGSTWQPITPKKLKGIPYTGTLPATLAGTKTGYLHRYKIYGNTEQTGTPTPENPITPQECGERTENLFDKGTVTYGHYITSSGTIGDSENWAYSDYIPVIPNHKYSFTKEHMHASGVSAFNAYYDINKNYISSFGAVNTDTTITTLQNAAYIRLSIKFSMSPLDDYMLVDGSTVPTEYIPYGYKLPLTSAGQDVDIYIGDDTISAEEYVDSDTGKIYRMVGGVLTPTDPPIPFPQIPTSAGSTTISWAGSGIAPSEFDSIQEWVDIPTYTYTNGAWVEDN